MKTKQTDARIKSAANKTACLALFGGSFDPVHNGHLKIACCALEQVEVDRVIFVPASQAPLKQKPFAKDADRLQMLRLALQDEANFELSTFEIDQNKITFTIDTVDHFKELYGSTKLFWIIGQDQFDSLDKWHRIDELVKKVVFLVYPRLESDRISKKSIEGLQYQILKAEVIPVSSTKVRKCCKEGLSLFNLVPDSVEAFIHEKGLYK